MYMESICIRTTLTETSVSLSNACNLSCDISFANKEIWKES